MQEKRLKDYIEAMSKDDYDEWFAYIENEEKELRNFLKKIDEIAEEILPQVADALNDTWNLPYEHKSIVDFIVDLYKCELTYFYDGGVEEYINDIKRIIQDTTTLCDDYAELAEIVGFDFF